MQKLLSEYKKRKVDVLALLREYGELDHSVDGLKTLPDALEQRAQQMRDNRFIIAVCGEVKAGKSTFINALIGAELLPTDRLQKSSVLVNICPDTERSLVVEFGDGSTKELLKNASSEDDSAERIEAVGDLLYRFASLQDEYRDLPSAEIENYILSRKPGKNDNLLNDVVEKLNLGDAQDHDLLDQFLAERGSPGDIPVHITLRWPLPQPELAELRIVDTPGVNALGGVQDRTYEFIEGAHATLFVHNIKHTASQSFRQFIEQDLTERSQESTLLVLTHAGDLVDHEKDDYAKQMVRDFPEFEDRMIPVDSELRLIERLLDNGMTLEEIKERVRDSDDHVKARLLSWIPELATRSDKPVEEVIRDQANFDALGKAIRQFASDARLSMLQEILSSLQVNLENEKGSLDTRVRELKKKLQSPQEFERRKEECAREYDTYQRKIGDFLEEFEGRYMGQGAQWRDQFDDIRKTFNERLAKLKSKNEIRKLFADANNEIDHAIDNIFESLREECERELGEIGVDFSDATKHQPPVIDLSAIEQKARKEAEKKQAQYGVNEKFSLAFWKWVKPFKIEKRVKKGYKTVVDTDKEINEIKGGLLSNFADALDKIVDGEGVVEKIVRSYVNAVEIESQNLVEKRKNILEEIKNEKTDDKNMRELIKARSGHRDRVEDLLERVQNLKANI